jgi:hypothetical protein
MRRLIVFAVLLFIIGVLIWNMGNATADDRAKTADVGPDFSGKVLIVNCSVPNYLGICVLEEVTVRKISDRAFLVGDSPKAWETSGPIQRNQTRYWIPLSEVSLIREYKSLKDAEAAVETPSPPPPQGNLDPDKKKRIFPKVP